MTTANDYTMSSEDANELKGIVLLPFEFRQKLLANYAKERGTEALVDLFADFIGLANSVVENTTEALHLLGILEADMHPHTAEKINSATLFGALQGVELASKVDQKKTCAGCAFRLGTLANQSPGTTTDAVWCVEGDEDKFMCLEHLDDKGEPTKRCGGYQQIAKRKAVANA